MVILPFMKHGDLHSFLLYSRLGDQPVVRDIYMSGSQVLTEHLRGTQRCSETGETMVTQTMVTQSLLSWSSLPVGTPGSKLVNR